jgi:hypothetical protein
VASAPNPGSRTLDIDGDLLADDPLVTGEAVQFECSITPQPAQGEVRDHVAVSASGRVS